MLRRPYPRFVASLMLLAAAVVAVDAQQLKLPNKDGSVKFAVIGDNGTGERPQYDLGALMAKYHDVFRFEHVIMLGDNMYGSQRPRDFETKFEKPYKVLLDRD